jgi:hypothetical protein
VVDDGGAVIQRSALDFGIFAASELGAEARWVKSEGSSELTETATLLAEPSRQQNRASEVI